MNPSIATQAAQSAAMGNRMLQDDRNQANSYTGQYNDFSNQATQANQAVKDYTGYMQGEGSAGNQYTNGSGGLNAQLGKLGYSQDQMTNARTNLNQAQGAVSNYNDFANTAASKWGMNAGGFAAANAGALGGLNNNIAAQQGVVNSLGDLYKTAQSGANSFAGVTVAGEHETMGGLQNVFTNASNQRDNAASMMNFYNQLASQQGGLNAQQAASYGAAQASYASASAALAQANLYGAQASLARQQYQHQQDLYNQPAGPTQQASNAMYAAMQPQRNGGGASTPWYAGIERNILANPQVRTVSSLLHGLGL